MPTTTLAGRLGAVMIGNPVTPVTLAQARTWKFDVDTDLIENTQGYGSTVPPWKEFILAAFSWTGTVEGNLDISSSLAWQSIAGNLTAPPVGAIRLNLYPDWAGNPSRYYSGLIWPKLSVEARLQSVIRFTMDFTGQGALQTF